MDLFVTIFAAMFAANGFTVLLVWGLMRWYQLERNGTGGDSSLHNWAVAVPLLVVLLALWAVWVGPPPPKDMIPASEIVDWTEYFSAAD